MEYTYKYPRPAVTADCVVMTAEENPQVLLIERKDDPYKGCWAFPGGFLNMDETTEQCAIRELREETGLVISKVQHIGTYSEVDRDPRGRTITFAYLALVDRAVKVKGQDDAAKAQWFTLDKLPKLAFDHEKIYTDAFFLYTKLWDEGIPVKKDMDPLDKADVLTSAMAHAMVEKVQQLGDVDISTMTLAVSKVFANFILSISEKSSEPQKIIDQSLKNLEIAFKIAYNDNLIHLNKEIKKLLEITIHENQVKIDRTREELMELIAKRMKNSEIN